MFYGTKKKVTGLTTGNVELEFRDTNNTIKGSVVVRVFKSRKIDILAQVVGWTYNFFWTVSFYPQVFYPHDGAVGDILFIGYNEFPETISSWIQL